MFACATAGTAADTASFGIRFRDYRRDYRVSPARTAKVAERYINWFAVPPPRRLSDAKPEASIQGPSRITPQWLTTVQERLYRSVSPKDRESENDGRWLTGTVVAAASTFFGMTSDLLPGEPHIYSSKRGDLVAEFATDDGTMTGIITQEFVVLFAVVDGIPIERRLVLGSPRATTRHELQLFTGMLRTTRHGPVGARS